MARTPTNFWAANQKSLNDANAASSNASADATIKHSGTHSYKLASVLGSLEYVEFSVFAGASDPGNDYCISFWWRTTDVTPSTEVSIVNVKNSTRVNHVALTINTDGSLRVFEVGGGATTIAATPGLSDNTWHHIQFYFQHSDPGDCEVFVDGVSKGSLTGKDFTYLAAAISFIAFENATSGVDTYIDDIRFDGGLTDSSDIPPDSRIAPYWSTKNSATPDDGGNDLDVGTWDLIQVVPFAGTVQAEYTASAAAGAVTTDDAGGSAGTGGPNTDADVENDPVAIKGFVRMSRGGGSGTAHYILLGNNVDGTTRSSDLNPTTALANYEFVSTSASVVPTTSEYCRIGIEVSGNQDFDCAGMIAEVLHELPAAASFPYHLRRIKRDNMDTLITL
jgi:hypothetical protein